MEGARLREELGFVTDADDDPNQPQLFEVNREWTPFGDDPQFVTINASLVPAAGGEQTTNGGS